MLIQRQDVESTLFQHCVPAGLMPDCMDSELELCTLDWDTQSFVCSLGARERFRWRKTRFFIALEELSETC